MRKAIPAPSPAAYVNALDGWRRDLADRLRAAARAVDGLTEVIKWGHIVYLADGPVLLIRVEEDRVLFGFWLGQRLTDIEPRLKPGGLYEMATLILREDEDIDPAVATALVEAAVRLNREHGHPARASQRRS